MPDRITANLPARSLDRAAEFYARLGFEVAYRDEPWMTLRRGSLGLEMVPDPGLDPATSSASACVRAADLDRLHAEGQATGLPDHGIPRLTTPGGGPTSQRMFALVDPDGNLLRCLRSR